MAAPPFNVAAFRQALDAARVSRRVKWKDIAAATGVSQSTLSRMDDGRRPDAASLAALSAWAGINPCDYITPNPPKAGMDTSTLMSSIREMVKAEVYVQMIATGVLHADPDTLAAWNAQYSRHETVVREQLEALGRAASSYKEPPRFR